MTVAVEVGQPPAARENRLPAAPKSDGGAVDLESVRNGRRIKRVGAFEDPAVSRFHRDMVTGVAAQLQIKPLGLALFQLPEIQAVVLGRRRASRVPPATFRPRDQPEW